MVELAIPEAPVEFDRALEALPAGFFFATLDDGTAEEVYVAYFRKTAGDGAQFIEAGDFESVRVFRMQW